MSQTTYRCPRCGQDYGDPAYQTKAAGTCYDCVVTSESQFRKSWRIGPGHSGRRHTLEHALIERLLWHLPITGIPPWGHISKELQSSSWGFEGQPVGVRQLRRLAKDLRDRYPWFRYLWNRAANLRYRDAEPVGPKTQVTLPNGSIVTCGQIEALYLQYRLGNLEAASRPMGTKKAAISRKVSRFHQANQDHPEPRRRRGLGVSVLREPYGRDAGGSGSHQSPSKRTGISDYWRTLIAGYDAVVQVPLMGPGKDGNEGPGRIQTLTEAEPRANGQHRPNPGNGEASDRTF